MSTPTVDGKDPQGQSVPIQLGPGYLTGIAWSKTGWLIIGFAAHPEAAGPAAQKVWQLRADGGGLQEISLLKDPECTRTDYMQPTALSDGRVGLVKICHLPLGTGPAATFSVVAHDLITGSTQQIFGPQDKLNPAGFSFDPGIRRAVVGDGGAFCATIGWLTLNGPEALPITLGSGTRSWRLDEAFQADPDQDCTKLGKATTPSWSPDGNQIAFLASPEAIGLSGRDRLAPPWEIYVMNPDSLRVRRVTEQLAGPSRPAWSPDSRWIAFSATIKGEPGTWLLDTSTDSLHRFTNTTAEDIAWSPEGKRVAILHDKAAPSEYPPDIEILLYDVASLLK